MLFIHSLRSKQPGGDGDSHLKIVHQVDQQIEVVVPHTCQAMRPKISSSNPGGDKR